MKSLLTTFKFPLLLLACSGNLAANQVPSIPIGSLKALQSHVVADTKAELEWQISYPVHNFNETDSQVTVKFITAAIGPRWNLQFGLNINGEGYQEFYNGVSEENPAYSLSPGIVVADVFLERDLEIEFLAKHERSQIPGQWVSSENPAQQQQIIKLKNGDPVPAVPPVQGQRSVADILSPYSRNGVISIGEHEKILLFELYTSDKDHFGFDIQDLILLVSHNQVALDE